MILVKPSYQILTPLNPADMLKRIEAAGRTCYKSEDKITEGSAEKFIKSIINRGHESVIEHESLSVRFICDRGVTHEIVRHRLASFSQESSRYCNYSKKGLEFIIPLWCKLPTCPGPVTDINELHTQTLWLQRYGDAQWLTTVAAAEFSYRQLLELGWKPEQARSVLPNSLKTEIVVTANLREWRTIFKQRAISGAAHPQMREIMIPLYNELRSKLPAIFDDLGDPAPMKSYS